MSVIIPVQFFRLDAENVFSLRSAKKRICNTLSEHRKQKIFLCAKSISGVINFVDEQVDATEGL